MKLAISNLAWSNDQDEIVYNWMNELGFSGLEIAPTKIFPETPYNKIPEAINWSSELKLRYNIDIASVQSIYYQRGILHRGSLYHLHPHMKQSSFSHSYRK